MTASHAFPDQPQHHPEVGNVLGLKLVQPGGSRVLLSVVDPNTLNLDPDLGFWPILDPDPNYTINIERKNSK